jgi:nitroimidazol reductase NimA-like FMN-containing flavoprotein (pyridoxamine 5'-phosphate oxidase superfamily)
MGTCRPGTRTRKVTIVSASDDHSRGSIREIPPEECVALLGTTTVGRLAFVDAAGQQLIPVNFTVVDERIYFRTTPDGILGRLADGHEDVAFGVDHNDVFRDGWNVTVRGSVAAVTDETVVETVLSHTRLHPWAGGDRPLVMAVTPRSIDGRRVKGH